MGRIPLIYFMQVRAIIALQNNRRAPAAGTVVVHMHLRRDGLVLDVSVLQSSGAPALDEEALKLIRHIGQFDPLPSDAIPFVPDFSIDQPIVFHAA